jgi:hypothetical protein
MPLDFFIFFPFFFGCGSFKSTLQSALEFSRLWCHIRGCANVGILGENRLKIKLIARKYPLIKVLFTFWKTLLPSLLEQVDLGLAIVNGQSVAIHTKCHI